MLNIYFGYMKDAIYDTATYFRNQMIDEWIVDDMSKKIIKDVDKSIVKSASLIVSPILGPISPMDLSGGVKTLLLILHDKKHIFNASTCGDNCAKWILKIGEERNVTINLRHIMNFGNEEFRIRVKNNKKIVKNMMELLLVANNYV